jgi:hypothetical protein
MPNDGRKTKDKKKGAKDSHRLLLAKPNKKFLSYAVNEMM